MGVSAEVKVVFAGAGELVAIAKFKVSHVCSMYVCIYIYIYYIHIYIYIYIVCLFKSRREVPTITPNPYKPIQGHKGTLSTSQKYIGDLLLLCGAGTHKVRSMGR